MLTSLRRSNERPRASSSAAIWIDRLFTIVIQGELDLAARTPREFALQRVEGVARIVLNLSGVTFVDSAGLAVLLDATLHAPDVLLRGASEPVLRLIEFAGVEDLFKTE